MNLNQYLQNPRSWVLKKFLANLLKERFPRHIDITDRVANSLVTDEDTRKFSELISDVYAVGYLKAINDHRDQLTKLGLKVDIRG